jgi:hypothetical protein
VRLPVDVNYVEQRARFRLALHCEDCVLWNEERDTCAHGYPTRDHREAAEARGELVFCKDFELA